MEIYFYDVNNRYIGNRELAEGEEMPANATVTVPTITDVQSANFIDGSWVVSEITNETVGEEAIVTFESRLTALEDVIMELLV